MPSSPNVLSSSLPHPNQDKIALLVDDDPHFLLFLRTLLTRHGFTCLQANNGLEGLTVLESEFVDLILSDINMPEMDGYEFLTAVRQQPKFELLPFILLTGKPAYSGVQSGLSRGADGYLPKPFDERTLIEAITNCFRRVERLEERADSKLNELRTNLLTMLPHELRTPLNGILGVADLLEMGAPSEEELEDYAKILRESGERMLRLATNFLLCAELQLHKDDPEQTTLLFQSASDCDSTEIGAILDKRAVTWNRGNDLSYRIDPSRVAIPAQAHAKMLDELLDNAFKFSTKGDPVEVFGKVDGSNYCWTMIDHGCGVARMEDLAERDLFVQFNRKVQEQQGAGLGIYLAERLVKIHHGSLGFAATPNGGLTVTVLLPLTTPPEDS